jgi:uncharacterized Zn finger protein
MAQPAPMPEVKRHGRENSETKGRRYLIEGRVVIRVARPGFVDAVIRGSDRFYEAHLRNGFWTCNCFAKTKCSHLVAVQLVTVTYD